MCLELVLAGLFPPLESDIFTESLNWQPIPFNVEQQEELIGIPLIYCSNFVRQYYKFMLSLEGKEMLDSYQNLYQQLSNYSGLAVTSPDEVLDVFETLESEQYYGLELLEWTSEMCPDVLEEVASRYFKFALPHQD
ncbi:venom acid phosphatase Acph-1-like [Zophobas morio]|uniref:venom acid phosphatase Acph-1-like n=1 Tax=Zophobas morio TaxID=2755281 RepID=UPI003082D76C